jgi:DNA repair protein RecN (Recombination protein N)
MLRFLHISHLAVIDSAKVEFGPGLTVLTGETGAGKSILVEAVGLLLGDRAFGDLVRTGEDAASIEAIFERGGEELLVRREITAQGRSRAFINGSLATAGQLKELAGGLIELHGQHEHHTLLDSATHLGVLDTYAHLEPLRAPVRASYDRLRSIADELAQVRTAVADRESRQDLLTFQLAELDRADVRPVQPGEAWEDAELAALRQVLASAERVERLCAESYASLYESDDAILAALGQVWRRVGELATIDPRFQPHLDAREAIKSQLEDLAMFLRRYLDQIDASPAKLQQVEERLAMLERLKRKYGPLLSDVVARRDRLRRELEDLSAGDERIGQLEAEYQVAKDSYVAAAGRLSLERRRLAVTFARQVEALLGELAMERTRFEVRFADAGGAESSWTADGFDAPEFFVSPNPGEDLRPLARVVSGGELSRLMLAIKTLTFGARLIGGDGERAGGAGAPGMIFDEIDAGIGGRVADVVGRKLRALGSAFQVLCITHLPQIAAYADTHVHIEKRVQRGRTSTSVKPLDLDGRVDELARMLGGEAVTDGLRASAREMLVGRAGAAKGEVKSKGESERAKAKGGRGA